VKILVILPPKEIGEPKRCFCCELDAVPRVGETIRVNKLINEYPEKVFTVDRIEHVFNGNIDPLPIQEFETAKSTASPDLHVYCELASEI